MKQRLDREYQERQMSYRVELDKVRTKEFEEVVFFFAYFIVPETVPGWVPRPVLYWALSSLYEKFSQAILEIRYCRKRKSGISLNSA